jgi:hypothetical protein
MSWAHNQLFDPAEFIERAPTRSCTTQVGN